MKSRLVGIPGLGYFTFIMALAILASLTLGCSKRGKDFSQENSSSSLPPDNGKVATLVFSSTPNGSAATTFRLTDTIYGRILNSGPGASGCAETFGVNDGFCQTPSNYTSMPNSDWSFDNLTSEWTATFSAGIFKEGTHKLYWKNQGTNKAGFVSIQVLPADKPLMVAVEYPYNKPETTYFPYEAIYFQVAQAPKVGSQGCAEIVGSQDGYCQTPSNWTDMPANGWTFSNTLQRWEVLLKPGEYPLGAYRLFWKNKNTNAVSDPIIITIAADAGPTIVFSKSAFGSSDTTFKTSDTIYGYIINGDPANSKACAEVKGESEGACNNLSAWTTMPNADWKYSQTNLRWEAVFAPNTFTPVEFTGFWRNVTTNKKSAGSTVKITN